MNINSMVFVTAFLPVVFILDRLCLRNIKAKNVLLLIASLFFYAWGNSVYALLLLCSVAVNYGIALLMDKTASAQPAANAAASAKAAAPKTALSKAFLTAGILLNIGLLCYYKYVDTALAFINKLSGSELFEITRQALPIGISIFTFSSIAYLVDVYRGKYAAEKNFLHLALYISFFAKVSVGPIARYDEFGPQLKERSVDTEKTMEGIRRFSYGLAKKMLIANALGMYVDKVYGLDFGDVNTWMAWGAAVLYPLQLYYDFSGFSDMAVGLGKMFGFTICENFDYPYLSGSVQEFWRRWHMSLGSWFRDYLYIPLGGSRKGKMRTYLNNMIVFAATGIWHGATNGFLLWGLLQGVCIIAERLGLKKLLDKLGPVKYIYTFGVAAFGFVMFRLGDLAHALRYYKRMAMPWRYMEAHYAWQELITNRCLIAIIAAVLGIGFWQTFVKKHCPKICALKGGLLEMIWCMALMAMSVLTLINSTYNPAIYLNF